MSHDFKLESTVNFYKKGKGYKNKVRIVTVKWLDDKNIEHSFSTGPYDKRTIDLGDYFRLI
ncbi:MAG: hypothetical protein LBD03_04720 [Methanobrevibacter sp.]|nr:hypothetical protein [Candidatus Methanovirga procula]